LARGATPRRRVRNTRCAGGLRGAVRGGGAIRGGGAGRGGLRCRAGRRTAGRGGSARSGVVAGRVTAAVQEGQGRERDEEASRSTIEHGWSEGQADRVPRVAGTTAGCHAVSRQLVSGGTIRLAQGALGSQAGRALTLGKKARPDEPSRPSILAGRGVMVHESIAPPGRQARIGVVAATRPCRSSRWHGGRSVRDRCVILSKSE